MPELPKGASEEENKMLEKVIHDMNFLSEIIQTHDQSIFQIVSSLNSIQSLLLEKGVLETQEVLDQVLKEANELKIKIEKAHSEKIEKLDVRKEKHNSESPE